jgi:methylated-DNA-[protein]-cysteine S-methyltransferase
MENTKYCQTPVGMIGISEYQNSITKLFFCRSHIFRRSDSQETPVLKEAARQLAEYFSGRRKVFSLPLSPEGTEYQKNIWAVLRDIPYGETRTYKQVAQAAGRPGSCRAVGTACHRNPIAILIPCHRVIGSNGGLVGYAVGLEIKKALLDLEKCNHNLEVLE